MCETAPRSYKLFRVPNGLKKLPKRGQKGVSNFPSSWVCKTTMAFLTDQSWHVLKSGYTGGGTENKDFSTGLQKDLINQSL